LPKPRAIPTGKVCPSMLRMSFPSFSNAEYSHMGGTLHNKHHHHNSTSHITITRKHHPFETLQFEIVSLGKNTVTIKLQDGSHTRIPRNWSNLGHSIECRQMVFNAVFTTKSAFDLLTLVELLLLRA